MDGQDISLGMSVHLSREDLSVKNRINDKALKMIEQVDLIRKQKEKKHGVDVLIENAPQNVQDKFEKQQSKLFKAIDTKDNVAIFTEGQKMINAWNYLEKIFDKITYTSRMIPLTEDNVWKVKHSSGHMLIIHNGEIDAKNYLHQGVVFNVEELVKFVPAKVLEFKQQIKSAKVVKVKERKDNE